MRRATCLAYFAWIALLVCGCAEESYLPEAETPESVDMASVDMALRSYVEPPRRTIQAPARADLIQRWLLPPGSPWVAYEKLTLPSALGGTSAPTTLPDVEQISEVRLARLAGQAVAAAGLPADLAWFVDLQGAASVSFAHAVSEGTPATVAAVPLFNNWPAPDELVPAEQTLAAMIALPPRLPLPGDEGARPMFLLDAWRLSGKQELIDDEVVDNRYMLTRADFPSADVLRMRGIVRVVYVVASDEITDEEDDLHDLFEAYASAGIALYVLDISTLARLREPGEEAWFVEMEGRRLSVRHRRTCVHDPAFYERAHGGFGGVHVIPLPEGEVYLGYRGGGG